MHSWSEAESISTNPLGNWRVIRPGASGGEEGALRRPVEAIRVRVAVPDRSADLAPTGGRGDVEAATPTDAELMARVAAGDQLAFAAVYDRHAQAVYGAISRYIGDPGTAEDIVQETYLALWTKSEVYSPGAGSLIGWLLTIARHRAIDRLRSAARRPVVVGLAPSSADGQESDLERLLSLGRPVAFDATAYDPSDVTERRWVRAVVRTAIDEMPEAERRVLELAYDQEQTQVEIAAILGLPLGTVKTRTRRALLRLRAMLEGVPDLGGPGMFLRGVDGRSAKETNHESL
jgi:RNA polymerase sigma-70 factor (ECF subfamily)